MSMRVPSGFFPDQGEHEVRPYIQTPDWDATTDFVFPQSLEDNFQDSFSVIPAGWFGNLFKKPTPPMALAGLANTLTGVQPTDFDAAFDFLCSQATLVPDESLQNDIDVSYRKAKEDDRVYSWEVVAPTRRRPSSYCRDECACICESIGKRVASQFPGLKVFSVRMSSPIGVYAFVGDSRRKTSYDYHVALALIDEQGRIGMIDPIIYGQGSVVSFEDWWGRFDHTRGDYGFRVRQFVNETI